MDVLKLSAKVADLFLLMITNNIAMEGNFTFPYHPVNSPVRLSHRSYEFCPIYLYIHFHIHQNNKQPMQIFPHIFLLLVVMQVDVAWFNHYTFQIEGKICVGAFIFFG